MVPSRKPNVLNKNSKIMRRLRRRSKIIAKRKRFLLARNLKHLHRKLVAQKLKRIRKYRVFIYEPYTSTRLRRAKRIARAKRRTLNILMRYSNYQKFKAEECGSSESESLTPTAENV